jgi:hypothetical protein
MKERGILYSALWCAHPKSFAINPLGKEHYHERTS